MLESIARYLVCAWPLLPTLLIAQEQAFPNPADSEPLPGLEEFVDGLVESTMAAHPALPGITISVVKDGEIILLKGYGKADLEKDIDVDPEKGLFRIGSISKTFTGLAVMQLVDQGKLDLDEDVNAYLEEFRIPDTFPDPVTLRSLIAHRAGFEDAAAGHLFERNAEKVLPLGQYLQTHMPERVRPVGLTSTYTNYGISLAGYIVAVVSNMDFPTYIEKNIFEPLGMQYTTAREPLGAGHPNNISPQREALLATGYAKGPDGRPVAKPFDFISQVGPAGAISSSAGDMARYMIARLEYDRHEDGRLVKPTTTAQMRHKLYNDRPLVMDLAYAQGEGWRDGYRLRWHNGGTTTFFSNMSLYPELKLGIFVSTNSSDGGPAASGTIPRLIFERYYPSKLTFDPPEPPADFTQRGQKYAGEFMITRRSYTMVEKLSALAGVFKFRVDQDGYLLQSGGGQETRWVEIQPGVFQTAEEDPHNRGRRRVIYFYENADGIPDRVSMTANDLTRITFWQSPRFFFLATGLAAVLAVTTLLGAWRRAGRHLDQTSGGKWASRATTLAAIAVILAAGGIIATAAAVAGGDFDSLMFDFPGIALVLTLYATLALIALTLVKLVLIRAAWKEPGWNLWRRLHYSAFGLGLVAMIAAFYEWNLIGFNYF